MIKLTVLRWEDYTQISRWVQSSHMGLKSEESFLTVVRERDVLMEAGSERCYAANFEDRSDQISRSRQRKGTKLKTRCMGGS